MPTIIRRSEDPDRIRAFRQVMDALSWHPGSELDSLKKLFNAVDDLADAEIRYYYRRRQTRAWISGATRTGAWLSGSAGLVLPLLAASNDSAFDYWVGYGYVFLAMAASLLAANSLFGGTDGHIRFVTTQLEIEKIVTRARVNWCEYLSTQENGNPDLKSGFEKIMIYANELHDSTISETGRWGETLMQELTRYEKSLSSKK
jgi:hypothetical protein